MYLLRSLISKEPRKRVLLGMSGGTDSSVAAILLQEAGYEVTGITFRFFDSKNSSNSIYDAEELSMKLGINHFVYDARSLFDKKIIEYFAQEYLNGRTPVPCVLCNNLIKWPLLLKAANEMKIEHIASGHYARIVTYKGIPVIAKGYDPDKDQSFFLWGLSESIRKRMLLPLGNLLKSDVRKFAGKKGFTKFAAKKDSIGVCFCPKDYRSFLQNHISNQEIIKSGFFIDENGKILGKHRGFPFYTVGQRRGLGIHFQYPIYVKEIRKEENVVVLAPLKDLYKKEMIVSHYRFYDSEGFDSGREVICKIRYRKQATRSIVKRINRTQLHVRFLEPLEMIAPGQSAVFYDGDFVIGGGIIDSTP